MEQITRKQQRNFSYLEQYNQWSLLFQLCYLKFAGICWHVLEGFLICQSLLLGHSCLLQWGYCLAWGHSGRLVAGSDYEDSPKHPWYQQQYQAFVLGLVYFSESADQILDEANRLSYHLAWTQKLVPWTLDLGDWCLSSRWWFLWDTDVVPCSGPRIQWQNF